MSFGKARAAVPAFAVVAGGQLARLAAVLLAVVLTLPALAVFVAAGGVTGGGWCCTLAASLGARLRPVCGPCGGVAGVGLAVLLAWPIRAAFRWRWRGLDWWRVVLAAVAVRAAPVAAVAVAGAPVKRTRRRWPLAGRWWRCAGGGVRLSKNGRGWRCWRCRVVVAVAGVEPAPLVAVLQWSRPWPVRAVVVSLRGWRCIP